MSDKPKVFVVEDHPIFRRGVEELIQGDYELVGSADTPDIAIEMILERDPDLVLLDVNLRDGSGAEVAQGLRDEGSEVKILVLSVLTSREDVLRMFRAGINGYVAKSAGESFLLESMEATLADGRPVSPQVAGYLLDIDEDIPELAGIERLTPKEREVTRFIARGYSYKETAAALDRPISVKTLENHMAHIFEKVGVASRHELARIAYETGFVDPEPGD